MEEIEKELKEIRRILLHLPEVQAAVMITMLEEWERAKLCGLSAKDLWDIIPPQEP